MEDIDLIISSITEYIEILISIAVDKDLKDEKIRLDNLKEQVINATTYEELDTLKNSIKEIDDRLNTNTNILTSREQALVDRGYDKEEVERLVHYNSEEFEKKKKQILDIITKGCKPQLTPICIYLGGQPGSGKSTTARRIKQKEENFVIVSLDNYRSYHPNYLEIENCINRHWKNKVETNNDTKGNDIADFTHSFAGIMSDKILDELVDKKYNILLEWGMRTPEQPIRRLHQMKEKGYINIVNYIMVHKDISKRACKIRADVMNNFNHIIRRVPDYFHDMCVSTLPSSAKTIYERACKEMQDIDQFMLTTRDNRIAWDHTHNEDIKLVYEDYLYKRHLSNRFSTNDESLAYTSYNEENAGFQEQEDKTISSLTK